MDLSGIIDEAEFFPIGTLSESIIDSVTAIIAKWDEKKYDEDTHPVVRFSKMRENYLALLRQFRNIDEFEQKSAIYNQMHHDLAVALGYEFNPTYEFSAFEEKTLIPLLGIATNEFGHDSLWLIQTPPENSGDESIDLLSSYFNESQFTEENISHAEINQPIEKIISDGIFELKNSPRFILIFGLSQIILIDKQKWTSRSIIRIELQEIFARNDKNTFNYICCLISREARAPHHGERLSDYLEEEAQRTINAVTSSLKQTVRDAIEILGQGVIDVTNGKIPYGPQKGAQITGEKLSIECLRYMYRLLFLFYVEANTKINLLDKKNIVYKSGYSIESLRELESHRLRTQTEKDGTYIWNTLQKTLQYFYEGESNILGIPSIKVFLLDPQSTPILSSISIRNETIQKIIRLLSLRTSGKSTSRISYAKLGISQLGAVYETLISFTGRIAEEDLIQIIPSKLSESKTNKQKQLLIEETIKLSKKTDEVVDPTDTTKDVRNDPLNELEPSFFVPKSRFNEFDPNSVTFRNNEVYVYSKGKFIYRLAGRDREKNASYYTPEPLARLLVKHALKERCKDITADEILDLKILEPAMGSAAFLVETTNQLADLYLKRKQEETGQTINQNDLIFERQKVRAFISDRNCFGVDLNPIAIELGTISLWLNSLHAGQFSPWFEDQLFSGNSLLGARRASYSPEMLASSNNPNSWLKTNPNEVTWKDKLPNGQIWQWLLPAMEMANYSGNKTLNKFADSELKNIKTWRKSGFFAKFEKTEIELLQRLSFVAECLYNQVAIDLSNSRELTNDEIELWPNVLMSGNKKRDFKEKGWINSRLTGTDKAPNTLPYKRLKTAMDAWCALWFWPLDKTDKLPSRIEFLRGMASILEGGYNSDGSELRTSADELSIYQDNFLDQFDSKRTVSDSKDNTVSHYGEIFRETNVENLIKSYEWLNVANEVSKREKFVHFDLFFADVLRDRGGFDLVVGNPPWSKQSLEVASILSDIDPKYVGMSAAKAKSKLNEVLEISENLKYYKGAYVSSRGATNLTTSERMNPLFGGGNNNLYRSFIELSLRLVSPKGFASLVHQDGHLGDPRSEKFREAWYRRVCKHFHFRNEVTSRNFSEVDHHVEFSLNIYRGYNDNVNFENIAHAFLPEQIDECYSHKGNEEISAIKLDNGKWDTRGHKGRIIKIDLNELKLMSMLDTNDESEILKSRFLNPINTRFINLFDKFGKLISLKKKDIEWQISGIWMEGDAQDAGIIFEETTFTNHNNQIVYNGPMVHVGNPFYKIPNQNCRNNNDYKNLHLEDIPNNYIPRTAFSIKNKNKIPDCSWDLRKTHLDFYRFAFRQMASNSGERTFIGAILPKEVAHINALHSVAFKHEKDLLNASAAWVTIPFDFLIRMVGKDAIHKTDIASLPWIELGKTAHYHILRLSSLTETYSELWSNNYSNTSFQGWSYDDHRLGNECLNDKWSRDVAYRTDFRRRMALVELDVLASQALGLSLEQLIDIYSIYFATSRGYEQNTWYDQKGNIVWTSSSGLKNVGFLEKNGKRPAYKKWKKILEDNPSKLTCTVIDDTLSNKPRELERQFLGPFDQCDRVEDYKRAWAHFERLKSEGSI